MGLRLGVGSVVNNDTRQPSRQASQAQACGRLRVLCADCGLRTQIRSNCWICRLIANGFFLFRGRDVAIAMNSVKILHAMRLAITAIAELLVQRCHTLFTSHITVTVTIYFYTIYYYRFYMLGCFVALFFYIHTHNLQSYIVTVTAFWQFLPFLILKSMTTTTSRRRRRRYVCCKDLRMSQPIKCFFPEFLSVLDDLLTQWSPALDVSPVCL